MSELPAQNGKPRSSRRRFLEFVEHYRSGKLDEITDKEKHEKKSEAANGAASEPKPDRRVKRRAYLREYWKWFLPHRYAVVTVMFLALLVAGMEMLEPLFMRFIIDRVLLNPELDTATRLPWLHLTGFVFLTVIVLSKLTNVLKDYRLKLLNVRIMLTMRRALYDRLLHLPLPKLWDMKTGGILSRLTGDVETTTGLLQMAVVSPTLSVIRLIIALGVLLALNWRLALMAMAVIPGAMLISFASARRIRPIYRTVRKDVEEIDGRVGEAVSGIRVVRAFGRERRELLDYLRGRHAVLRKELFAHRRELVLWTSWGLLLAGVNVVIVWYGGYLNIVGRASIGDIMAFQWYTFLLLGPVWNSTLR